MIDRMLPKMTISIFSIHKVNSFSWFVSSSELKAGVNFLHFLSLENRDQRFFISSMGLRGGLGTTGKAELSLRVLSKSRHITFWAERTNLSDYVYMNENKCTTKNTTKKKMKVTYIHYQDIYDNRVYFSLRK